MEYQELPQPDQIETRVKEDAMGAYLMMFATSAIGIPLPILNLVAAIIYYYVNRSKGKFVQFHTLQSLWSQIPVTFLNSGLVAWTIVNFVRDLNFTSIYWGYLVMVATANLVYFIFSIIGAVKARSGIFYYFLFFGKMAYHQVYRIKPEQERSIPRNRPPGQ
jgi:uncharacterized membrane protein